MKNKTNKCFCCGYELKNNEQVCPKCGAVMPIEVDMVEQVRTKKMLKWSSIAGLIAGLISSILFGELSPNSNLFLCGIIIGVVAFVLTYCLFSVYYNHVDSKSISSSKGQSREEKWLEQEKNDKIILNRGDEFANRMLSAISVINATWESDKYIYKDREDKNAEYRSKIYVSALTPDIFLKNYYLFKAGNHDDIKDALYKERPYLVLETLIQMGLFIFETKNNIRVLREIIEDDREEYLNSKVLAQRILTEELRGTN